jgi:hypothetical protein
LGVARNTQGREQNLDSSRLRLLSRARVVAASRHHGQLTNHIATGLTDTSSPAANRSIRAKLRSSTMGSDAFSIFPCDVSC